MKFSEMTYTRPDLDRVLAACAASAARIRAAATPE